jgi:hypothetical protein
VSKKTESRETLLTTCLGIASSEAQQTIENVKLTLQKILLWIDNKEILLEMMNIVLNDLVGAGELNN